MLIIMSNKCLGKKGFVLKQILFTYYVDGRLGPSNFLFPVWFFLVEDFSCLF